MFRVLMLYCLVCLHSCTTVLIEGKNKSLAGHYYITSVFFATENTAHQEEGGSGNGAEVEGEDEKEHNEFGDVEEEECEHEEQPDEGGAVRDEGGAVRKYCCCHQNFPQGNLNPLVNFVSR